MRDNQPIVWALRPGRRGRATRCVRWPPGSNCTMLPGCTRGSTVPEKRSTSTFWFTPICLSPASTRWPLGSTSITVAVIEPEKVLALSVPPLPEVVVLADSRPAWPGRSASWAEREGGDRRLRHIERCGCGGRRLLAGGDVLHDLDRQDVARTKRARGPRKPGGSWRCGTGCRWSARPQGADARRALQRVPRTMSTCGAWAGSRNRPRGSQWRPVRQGEGQRSAHHSCPSFCSIWSEVWTALEFIS
jgi:hypothetical protein